HGAGAAAMLACCLADPQEPQSLRPKAPRLYIDSDYLLYACGLLAEKQPAAALTLGLKHMHPVGNAAP
ncbi:MAG TPA: glutamate mutase L, partial [Rhodospirillales bacterium]